MCLRLVKAGHWEALASLYQAVQSELGLPAPAISVSAVSGQRGYGLWFALAEAVPLPQAGDFLTALHGRYLLDVPPACLTFDLEAAAAQVVPMLDPETGRWSAYIDPTLGAMFADEPWLEMAPNPDKQADLLAALECIKPEAFQQALARLQQLTSGEATAPLVDLPALNAPQARLASGAQFADPKSFLLAVMNDTAVSAELRVQAAIALLPHFGPSPTPGDSGH